MNSSDLELDLLRICKSCEDLELVVLKNIKLISTECEVKP